MSRVFKDVKGEIEKAILTFENGNMVGVVVNDVDADGKTLLLGFHTGVQLDGETVTRLKSAYGIDNPKEWVENQIKGGKIARVYDIEKADNFLNGIGYKAERTRNYQLGDIVSLEKEEVKQRYSASEDSEGNRLSDGQMEYFAHSEVVDRGGRFDVPSGNYARRVSRRTLCTMS